LSAEAKVGQLLVLIAIALDILGIVIIFALNALFSTPGFASLAPSGVFRGFILFIGVVALIGLATGIYAYQLCSEKKYREAGIFAVISALLPFDIIMLIGAILLLISKEAKG